MYCSTCSNTIAPTILDNSTPDYSSTKFKANGDVNIKNTGVIFEDTVEISPFSLDAINSNIQQLFVLYDNIGFTPTFFNVPSIHSLFNNISLGIFTKSSVVEEYLMVTTYLIPYKNEASIDKIAKLVIYLNIPSKIVWYQVPNEFTYQSKELVSIAIGQTEQNIFNGKVNIPNSFFNSNAVPGKYVETNISAILNVVATENENITANAIATKTTASITVSAASCPPGVPIFNCPQSGCSTGTCPDAPSGYYNPGYLYQSRSCNFPDGYTCGGSYPSYCQYYPSSGGTDILYTDYCGNNMLSGIYATCSC